MNKLWKTTYVSILLPIIIAIVYLDFHLSFIGLISSILIILTIIFLFFTKKKKLHIIFYILLFISYISFWFDLNLLNSFSFNSGSILPISIAILFPYIGFGLYASDKDSGFKGTLQIRANYKIQDSIIVKKVNKYLIPYSLLSCSIINFPLIFYFSKTYKILISFIMLCTTIIFIEIYIRILVQRKRRIEKTEMNEYIENIKNKS